MTRSSRIDNHPGRQKGLACTLALALALGLTGAATAVPVDQGISPQSLGGLDLQQVPAEFLAPLADVLAGQAQASQALAGTITVTSCANNGSGTLRAAVAAASSGDTIDLSQLSCNNINLTSGEITVPVASLVIKGTPGTGVMNPPKPTIDALHSGRVFKHTGTGTLTLRDIYARNGFIDYSVLGTSDIFGGCIYSDGNVKVDGTFVESCSAESGNKAAGGGIYAKGNITLDGDSLIVGNKVKATWYAWGGGLYTAKSIIGQGNSAVNTNSATVEGSGFAKGGGIYAGTGMIGGALTLEHNTAQEASGASAQAVQGGGAWLDSAVLGTMAVNDNHALGGGNARGGGLYVDGTTFVNVSTITNNDAAGYGGGLYTVQSTTVKASTVSNNSSGYDGGGIYVAASLTVEASTVADNTADSIGGGMYVSDGLTLKDSTVLGNHGDIIGGGIYAHGNAAIKGSTVADNTSSHTAGAALGSVSATTPITIDQSTISGNRSDDSKWGAGLYVTHDTIIKNSTITKNVESNAADTQYGAGISLADGVQLTLFSTIVSDNGLYWYKEVGPGTYIPVTSPDDIGKAAGGTAYDILGDYNLVGHSTVPTPTDTISAAAQLDALDDNGGPTQTHLPKPGSPAIDHGKDNGFSCDQRGDGFARVVGFTADIGAVEIQAEEVTDRIFADGFESASTNTCN